MNTKLRLEAILDIAQRYNFDAVHSHQVECLAGTIFMELAELHNLEREDRKLLEYAAILHDIGNFVSESGHHRHTLMLILTEPLIPFTRDEVKIIANVARYHRKALPSPEHTLFGALSEPDRRKVCLLGAMLRVADALDHSHQSLVRELTCEVMEDAVIFNLTVDGKMTSDFQMPVEWDAIQRRGDLFRDVFRKAPRINVQQPRLASPQAVFQNA